MKADNPPKYFCGIFSVVVRDLSTNMLMLQGGAIYDQHMVQSPVNNGSSSRS